MQKPRPLPKDFYVTKMYKEASMKESNNRLISFKLKTKIPENLYFLMELLYRSQNIALSLEELQNQYADELRDIKISSLKCQISKLRRILDDNPEYKFTIVKRKRLSFAFVIIEGRKKDCPKIILNLKRQSFYYVLLIN